MWGGGCEDSSSRPKMSLTSWIPNLQDWVVNINQQQYWRKDIIENINNIEAR